MRVGILFSSGKDSCFAMYKAGQLGHDIKCLITIESENPFSYMFHTPNVSLAKYQSEALDIPLIVVKTKGEKEEELKDLKKAIEKAKQKYNLDGIVTGALFSKYQWTRVDKICADLELMGLAPLWQMDQGDLLKELVKNKFRAIIVAIACDGLDKSWLGREIDKAIIKKLKQLKEKIGINMAGEGGEYESFVLDCPMFKKKIVVKDAKTEMENENTGVYVIRKVEFEEKLDER